MFHRVGFTRGISQCVVASAYFMLVLAKGLNNSPQPRDETIDVKFGLQSDNYIIGLFLSMNLRHYCREHEQRCLY